MWLRIPEFLVITSEVPDVSKDGCIFIFQFNKSKALENQSYKILETSGKIHPTIQHHTPQDLNPHSKLWMFSTNGPHMFILTTARN